MLQRQQEGLDWTAHHIAYIMQSAIDALKDIGVSDEDARESLMKRLRDQRRKEVQEWLSENPLPEGERDARTAGLLIMQWEAALGVDGEIMVNTPERFVRRFYGGDPWSRHLTGLINDIMGAEAEGFAQGVNPKLTFRTNRMSWIGDPYDEWVIEPMDEGSAGREPRIPWPERKTAWPWRAGLQGKGSARDPRAKPKADDWIGT